MPSKRTLNEGARPGKAAKLQRTVRTQHDGGATEGSLCSQCSKINLMTMFSQETNALDLGLLECFTDLTCAFCTILWDCIRLHWSSASPLDNGAQPRLYIQSKHWGSYQKHQDSSEGHLHRILLAITEQPPGFQRNRRLISTDKRNRFIIGELELVGQADWGERPALIGFRRAVGSLLNMDIIRGWLQACGKHKHGFLPNHGLFRGGFRLIDVEEAKLVERTEPCEYAALSYVWGPHDPSILQTTKSTLSDLQSPFALDSSTRCAHGRIPRTVTDAMKLCKAIGYRYLWVDCLCIVQDDEADKKRLIHGMGHVYENASLTVVAAVGQDSDAGLAGITARENLTNEKKYVVRLPIALATISIAPISLEEQVRKSHWNTRAWTLQELSLSERSLYFTPDEVFFECRTGIRRECYAIENFRSCSMQSSAPFWGRNTKRGVHVPFKAVFPKATTEPWTNELYADVVSNYSRRSLSYSHDVFNAFAGIYQRCTSAQPDAPPIFAVQGLNSANFMRSLLWFIAESDNEKIQRRHMAHGHTLASWSWASWMAPVDFICIANSSFPSCRASSYHVDTCTFSFVDDCSLTIKDGSRIYDLTISGTRSCLKPGDDYYPLEFLKWLPRRPLLQKTGSMVGSLHFVAPCVTVSPDSILVTDAKISDGGYILRTPGYSSILGIIMFDSDDEYFTEIVLVMASNELLGLCTRTEDGVSRRIGVAQLHITHESDWKMLLEAGTVKLQWTQVCLV